MKLLSVLLLQLGVALSLTGSSRCWAVDRAEQALPTFEVVWRTPMVVKPESYWKPREHGAVIADPSGQTLYVPCTGGVRAVQASNGKEIWRFDTPEHVDGTPALFAGTLYAATTAGAVYALDAASGAPVWAQPTRLEAGVEAPLAADITQVYLVADPGAVIALDRMTGRPAWRYSAEVTRDFLIEGQGGVLPYGKLVVAGLPNGKLVALAVRDGGLTWSVDLANTARSHYADIDSTPVLVKRPQGHGSKEKFAGDWLLAASHSGGLFAVTASEGAVVWQIKVEAMGQPVVRDGFVYAVSSLGELHKLELASGRRVFARKWAGAVSGQLAVTDASRGLVLVPNEGGLDAAAMTDGAQMARAMNENGYFAAPLLLGGRVYSLSNGGILYAMALH